ncbi:unnamed protein product [Schistosoma turkestanicum]|nr:unnamed protein product [Schistosoma turkestanicum]
MGSNQITKATSKTLQLTIKDYANRLRIAVDDDWKIQLFREYYPCRFQEFCMIHLSFLIDVPWNFIDQKISSSTHHNHNHNDDHNDVDHHHHHHRHALSNPTIPVHNHMVKDVKSMSLRHCTHTNGVTKSKLKRLWNNWRSNSHSVKSDCIPERLAKNIISLIDCLDNDEACCIEGLFRKAGHMLRKRQIQDAVFQLSFDPKLFQLNKYNFHDFASALKSVLMRLPTPLFTEQLLPLFLQVAALRKFKQFSINEQHTSMSTLKKSSSNPLLLTQQSNLSIINEDYLLHLIESKQIKALRLLIQLLPNTNANLLKRLIILLTRVKNFSHINRMTSTCLGTIFGPVLLPQGILYDTIKTIKNYKQPPIECQEKCFQLNSITRLLIDIGLDIFLLPYSLVHDICNNSPYMRIFKTYTMNIEQPPLEQLKTNHLTFSSPQTPNQLDCLKQGQLKRHNDHNDVADDKDDKDDDSSSPLRTTIRFATPTPTSIANCQVLNSSPIHLNDIIEMPRTLKTKQQHHNTQQTPIIKWSQSTNELSSSSSSSCSLDQTEHLNLIMNKEKVNYMSKQLLLKSTNINLNKKICRLDNQILLSTSMNNFSPSNYSHHSNELIEDIHIDDKVKRKFGKTRRFTELRLPSSINRTVGRKIGHRRYLFSPCPPIPLLPFKRVGGGEKRPFKMSPHSTLNGPVTTTALPSW